MCRWARSCVQIGTEIIWCEFKMIPLANSATHRRAASLVGELTVRCFMWCGHHLAAIDIPWAFQPRRIGTQPASSGLLPHPVTFPKAYALPCPPPQLTMFPLQQLHIHLSELTFKGPCRRPSWPVKVYYDALCIEFLWTSQIENLISGK